MQSRSDQRIDQETSGVFQSPEKMPAKKSGARSNAAETRDGERAAGRDPRKIAGAKKDGQIPMVQAALLKERKC